MLSSYEIDFLTRHQPLGVILFARNCQSPAQIQSLTQSIRACLSHPYVMILIDQEGGRVARLRPPHWRAYPAAARFAELASSSLKNAMRATYLNARLIAQDLSTLGINVNCAPMADIMQSGSHNIIGDRAFGTSADQVTQLARAQAQGLHDGGVMSILKHIPGHGRATADSHENLPIVDTSLSELEQSDFIPFKALADLPMAMTAHIVYSALDATKMATLSPVVIRYIREKLGFKGLLMSDDLSMKALSGDFSSRARAVWEAGCDIVLHCNGNPAEMDAIASVSHPLSAQALKRVQAAFDVCSTCEVFSDTLIAELHDLAPDLYRLA